MGAPTKHEYRRATRNMVMEESQQRNKIPAHLGASFIEDYAMTQNIAQRLQFTRRYLLLPFVFACTRVV